MLFCKSKRTLALSRRHSGILTGFIYYSPGALRKSNNKLTGVFGLK